MRDTTDIQSELKTLPHGTIVCRKIRGTDRYYHQWRENGRTRSKYLSAGEIMAMRAKLNRRDHLLALLHRDDGAKKSDTLSDGFHCEVICGRFLAEFAAATGRLKKRDSFTTLLDFVREGPSEHSYYLIGPRGTGKTTLLRQLANELPPTVKARTAYIRLTGEELPREIISDVNILRELGFRILLLDNANALKSLPGAGMTVILAGETVTDALREDVKLIDTTFIPLREYSRVIGIENPEVLIEDGGTLGKADRVAGHELAHLGDNDRFVLEVLAMAALRTKSSEHAHGEAFLGSDLQKLKIRFSEIANLKNEDDIHLREKLLSVPNRLRYAHVIRRISELMNDPILERLGVAERKLVRDRLIGETRFRLLEDTIWNELKHMHNRQDVEVHRLPFATGNYGFVVADGEELTCEVIVFTTDVEREAMQRRYLEDPVWLDAIEHRYGTITGRTVLYNGRDAGHSSGVSYRNLAKYLTSEY